jgi:pyridoxal phosphate enzyme (YggS family)
MPEHTQPTISARIAAVQREIAAACQRANRAPDSVTLIAVSKTHPASDVVEAIHAGLRSFGENRIEEALGKMPAVADLLADQAVDLAETPVQWHMVGHVQSRKARYVASGFAMLHSLDSVHLAERLSHFVAEQETQPDLDVLLEINVSGEESKYGWNAAHWQDDPAVRRVLWDDVTQILDLPGLNVRGVMTMAPIVEQAEDARPVFVALRELRDALANDFPASEWTELSMGMTDDYPVAIEEGATLVRIGRAIFGPRA